MPQLTTTTPLALAVVLGLWVLGPVRGLWLVLATLPLGAAAAVTLPGLGSISLTEAALIALWPPLLWQAGAGRGRQALASGTPGFALVVLMVFAALSAVFSPRLFAGMTEVYSVVRSAEGGRIALMPLAPVSANLGQFVRLTLSASGFVALACALYRVPDGRAVWRGLWLATGLNAALVVVDLLAPALIEPLRSADMAMLAGQDLDGVVRLTGGFPEASAFAYFTIGLFGLWLRAALAGVRGAGWALCLTTVLLLRSTASSAYVGMALVTGLVLLRHLGPLVVRGAGGRLYAVGLVVTPVLVAGAALVLFTLPAAAALTDALLWSKLDSASGVERMAWNAQALTNLSQTWGLGAGLGSLRASSWAAAVLGSLGGIGAAIFAWFLVGALRPGPGGALVGALRTGAFAVLVQAQLTRPHPDLGPAFFLMAGMAAGLVGAHNQRKSHV